MVVSTQEEYEELAVELGTNHAKRLALREKVKRNRLHCPLFDTRQWVKDLDRLLLHMWDHHAGGGELDHIDIGHDPEVPKWVPLP
mmetsp:Transcript_24123/g.75689  ORF Transcript_24123/g.75689 Transcript_24123/m.75689 type:complete len:85 (-) Transcript_24123:100-354(-)